MSQPIRRALGALLLLLVLVGWARSLDAATITVNTTLDVVDPNDGRCSLREAIIAANTNAPSGPAPGECAAGQPTDPITDLPVDDIVFADLPGSPDVYRLTLGPPDEDLAAGGDLDILESVNLIGVDSQETIIERAPALVDRIFHVIVSQFTIAVSFRKLTVRGGFAARGGGIFNFAGDLLFQDSVVAENVAGQGGGIFNDGGTLGVFDTSILDNWAICMDREPGPARGGGIFNSTASGSASAILAHTTVSGNIASCDSGNAEGAGIYSGDAGALLEVDVSLVTDNHAFCSHPGCASRGAGLANRNSTLEVLASEVRANDARCVATGCTTEGGGIASREAGGPPGVLHLGQSTVADNVAECLGSQCAQSVAQGGGIFNGAALQIRRSTLARNAARSEVHAVGGGLANVQTAEAGASAIVENSTFSANAAECGGPSCAAKGSGLFNQDGVVVFTHATLTANSADLFGGGLFNSGALTI